MRGAIGPILTTGVALAAAGVVVANPIVAPRADVQIPAVQLSAGSGDAAGMLDQAFLDAIAPSPPESTNPFSVLRQLISSLAADATYIGKNAIVDAFVAGVTAVSQPELTASSTPYVPSIADSPELAASVLPGLDLETLAPLAELGSSISGPVTAVAEAVPAAVQTLVAGVVTDAGFVGGQIIVAAFAVGAVVAAEPGLIRDTLEALIQGDLSGALQSAVKVVAAPLGPPVIILNAVRSVFEKNLDAAAAALASVAPALSATTGQPEVAAAAPAAPQQSVAGSTSAPAAVVGNPPTSGDGPARSARDSAAPAPVAPTEGADPTDAGSSITAAVTRAQSGGAAQNDAAPSAGPQGTAGDVGAVSSPATSPRGPLRAALDTVEKHLGAALGAPDTATGSESGSSSAAKAGNRARTGNSGSSDS